MLDLSIHFCKSVKAHYAYGEETSWLDLQFTTRDTEELTKLTVFFEDAEYARRLAEAINGVPQ